MIAVLGSEHDVAARRLVQAWAAEGAVLVSAQDLSTRGWAMRVPHDAGGAFVAGGRAFPVAGLRGVVVRRPAVAAEELSWIAADDRSYAMAEVNAFLVAWLSSLTCPVLNRPTATSLCGPGWSQTHWRIAAARARVRWCNSDQPDGSTEVVFCRGLHHGMVTELGRQAGVRLAQEARVDLLGVRFAGDGVAAVTLQPGLAEPGARELVLAQLCSEVSV